MSESTEAPWQSDWSLFIDELGGWLRTSEDTDELARRFGNQSIEWEGAHRAASGKYQKAWEGFLDKPRSQDEIIGFGKKLSERFGFDWQY
ncbi:hypothetical protein [Aeoliella mucimassa]|uniref:hypothetical protein n=1 Tax=Aeoliella mucimassa TaxID=2527972 RepID=UPI0011A401F6|nr:hypothetical protein [Aeoliella mucimassa]